MLEICATDYNKITPAWVLFVQILKGIFLKIQK